MLNKQKKTGIGGGMPGPGRPKGSKGKIPADVKKMVLKALDAVGGEDYLIRQADENPKAFLSLVSKMIPTEVTGKDGKDLIPPSPSLNVLVVPEVQDEKTWLEQAEKVVIEHEAVRKKLAGS